MRRRNHFGAHPGTAPQDFLQSVTACGFIRRITRLLDPFATSPRMAGVGR